MRKTLFFFFAILLLLNFNLSAQLFGEKKDLVKIETFKSFDKIQKGGEFKVAVKLDIAEKWHINSNTPNEDFLIKSEIVFPKNSKFEIVTVKYPEAKNLKFSFSDTPVSVYEGTEYIGAIVKAPENIEPGQYSIPFEFTYQACNDITCMAPVTLTDTIKIEIVDNKTPINEINSEIFSQLDLQYSPPEVKADEKSALQRTLESSGILLSLLIVFIGGLALNLTPCVYPLIPITIGYFGSQSEGNTKRLAMLGVVYVLGMALTYSVVGVVTALSGAVFGSLMQNPIVILIVAAVLVGLALSMFDVYEFKLPDSWVMKAGNAKAGAVGAFMMGLTMGIVAAPCIGPFVLGLVTYVAAKGDVLYGFLMFFFMALGLGTPYLFLAIFSGKIKSLPRAGMWMKGVERIFGFILIGMALYFILPLLPKSVSGYVLPVFAILISLYLLFIDKLANEVKGYRIFKTVFAIAALGVSVWMLIPSEKNAPEWEHFTNEAYETALNNHRKIVIDFYADWCIPCKELDGITFADKKVIDLMKDFVALKVDMTKSASDETEKIRKKFNIVGMPTIIFFNSEGKEVERLTGFVPPEEFAEILKKID
jgi:thiol:disulfide interchange protein DsbD